MAVLALRLNLIFKSATLRNSIGNGKRKHNNMCLIVFDYEL